MTVRTHKSQKSVWSPCPMSNNWINKTSNANTIKNISTETCTTDHGARYNRRARVCKSVLKNPVCQDGNTGCKISFRSSLKEKPMISNETISFTEHKRITNCPKKQSTKTCIENTFHQHIHCFSLTCKTCFQHNKTGLHT